MDNNTRVTMEIIETTEIKELKKDNLRIRICDSRCTLGMDAAQTATQVINQLLTHKKEINILFAAAPSQNEFLAVLQKQDLPWHRIHALHMDEYVGLKPDAPQRFGNFLKEHIFDSVPFQSVNYLFREGATPEEICNTYERILQEHPLDIIFMGIGENGHIAFNDPHVARFDDPQSVKIVSLDEVCRMQQVHDGCFSHIDEVPRQAVTVTIPVMLKASYIFCMVPGKPKAKAVKNTLYGPISTECPASILRTHPHATLYCDLDSASLLPI
ncbi:glucosamine-6-phosphate deaminase [uncultured Bacteroides sp.]|jgi:glucosamine-6-phosphate deaminase|uniref:glucosamine-6-phosphate deaminase n=1 Tax=uncultured Bacteroides sp. TaxID=162156 RepID=UPI0025854055|nr:glucosamine-6-phosphate deaminase [uncultured Bacteroides sp.]